MPDRTLGVGLVGYGFMGRAHTFAWQAADRAFDLPLRPTLRAIAGRSDASLAAAARSWGWSSWETDWRRLLERDDIDVIDICAPGGLHAEIATAALAAGKHVLCEKPLADTVAEAQLMSAAAADAARHGVRAMVGFNYRRVPALAAAADWVAKGVIGDVRHIRALYLQDWIVDPEFPLVWRLQKDKAGSGALGDLGAHLVDLAQHLSGQRIVGVSALTETFVPSRPIAESGVGLSGTSGSERGEVTVDDAAVFLARLDGGAIATFEATRFATGHKNALQIELNGSLGSIAFDFESMNELLYYSAADDPSTAGFRRVLTTDESHPYISAWWPPGHGIGYEHTFVHQARDFIEAIAQSRDPRPTFADGLQVQQVLQAVEDSAANESAWTRTESIGAYA